MTRKQMPLFFGQLTLQYPTGHHYLYLGVMCNFFILRKMKLTTFRIEKILDNKQIILYPTVIQVKNKYYLIDCGYEETFDEFVTALLVIAVLLYFPALSSFLGRKPIQPLSF